MFGTCGEHMVYLEMIVSITSAIVYGKGLERATHTQLPHLTYPRNHDSYIWGEPEICGARSGSP